LIQYTCMMTIRRVIIRFFLFTWAFYTAFAQPGLPACWLEAKACQVHVHFSQEQAETPHDHGYLVGLASGMAAAAVPQVMIPAGLLVALLAVAGAVLLKKLNESTDRELRWLYVPEPPPPKNSF
jgi:hypothetical protein